MKNVKQISEHWSSSSSPIVGTVVHHEESLYRVRPDVGLLPAVIAASCLLKPEVGDKVILTFDNLESFITSVLVKANTKRNELVIPGALVVHSESVSFKTRKQFEVASETLDLQASLANMKFGVLNQLALKMSWVAEKLEMTAAKLHRSAKQEYIVVNQQFERVTETKNTQAGRWIQRVHKQWIARSERTTLTAKKEMRLDGERIDLG